MDSTKVKRKSCMVLRPSLDEYTGESSQFGRYWTNPNGDQKFKNDRGKSASAAALNSLDTADDDDWPGEQQSRQHRSSLGVRDFFARPNLNGVRSPPSSSTLTLSAQPICYRKCSDPRYDQPKSCYIQGERTDYAFVAEMQRRILKAKAEGRTVSVIDGRVFIDYRYVAPLPDGCRV